MAKYRRRLMEVEAHQFFEDRKPWPPGVKVEDVGAVDEDDVGFTYRAPAVEGIALADGDWVVRKPDGTTWVYTETNFAQEFEPADPKVGDAGDLEELPQMAEVEAARVQAAGEFSDVLRKLGEKVIVGLADALEEYARTGTVRGICQVCGCTELDCRQCVEKTGKPCHWVDATQTLCSACAQAEGQSETGLRFMVNALPFPKRDELAARCGDIPRDERVQIANHHGRGMGETWHPGVLADKDEILRDIQADADLRDDCALLFLMVELNRAMLEVEKERA